MRSAAAERVIIAGMRALLKFLLIVVLVGAVCLGGAWWWAGRMSGPVDRSAAAGQVRRPGDVDGPDAAGARRRVLERHRHAVAERQGPRGVRARAAGRGRGEKGSGRPALRDQADRPEGDSRSAQRRGAHHGAGIAAGALRPARGRDGGHPRRAGAARAAAARRALARSTSSTTAAASSSSTAPTPRTCSSGVRVGDKEYPGFPATGVGIAGDPAAARGVLRAAVRPAARRADPGVRARRGRQRGGGGARQSRVPQAVSEEPHRDRRPVPRPRGSGDCRQHAG